MKRVKIAAVLGIFAASLTLASASSSGDEAADGYVFDAMSAPATVSYIGTVEVTRIGAGGSETTIYRIEHRAPNLTKRTYLSPQRVRNDEVVTRGDETFAVDEARRRVIEMRNDAAGDEFAFDNNYLLLRANYRAVKESAESLDGRPIETIALVNKHSHRTTMIVRVDKSTKLVLDKQRFAADGSMIGETRFERVAYVEPQQADFAIPAAFEVVKGAALGAPSTHFDVVVKGAGFDALRPKYLPAGFTPVEGNVVEIRGVRTLHLLYSDGIQTLSLFEHAGATTADLQRFHPKPVSVAGRSGLYADNGSTALLAWQTGDLHCALVGDMTLSDLRRIAASIAP